VLLILANGFFVAGEFALVAVDRNKIEQMASEGHSGARSTLRGLKTLSFQLSGAQLGITVTSLLVGYIAEPTVAVVLEPLISAVGIPEGTALGVSLALAFVLATATQMVVGELMPKNLAIARPLNVAFLVITPLRWCNAILKPLITFLNASANKTVRMLGIEPREELIPVRSLEELELLIGSSREGGALKEEQFSLLKRSITFGEKTAVDAMVPRMAIAAISLDSSLADMARLAITTGHSRFPVYGTGHDDVAGVVHVKDSFSIPAEERDVTPVQEIMRKPLFVTESRDLEALLIQLRRESTQLAIVLDEYGVTAGIITLEDLLEEIVGDIEDEYDPSPEAGELTAPIPEGVHVLSGLLHHDEVLDVAGFDMPEDNYETLAGFLLSLLHRIPVQGDHAWYRGWEFKIIEMDGNRISKVLLIAPSEDEDRDES